MKCFECEEKAEYDHHVVPKVLGGTKTVPLCDKCHSKIHQLDLIGVRALTTEGLRQRQLRQQRVGEIPYGWDLKDKDNLSPNPEEQKVIKIITLLKEKHHLSYGKITQFLNNQGIKSKQGKTWHPKVTRSIYLKTIEATPLAIQTPTPIHEISLKREDPKEQSKNTYTSPDN